MEDNKSNRTRILKCRLTPEEYTELQKKWQKSTSRKLSNYVRQKLFDKGTVATYRNLSIDDFMAEMSELRRELNHIGNNFNQSVKRLHTLNQITEFKTWLITYEIEKSTLSNKLNEIKNRIQKIAESWLR